MGFDQKREWILMRVAAGRPGDYAAIGESIN